MSLSKVADSLLILLCVVLGCILATHQWQRSKRGQELARSAELVVGRKVALPTAWHEASIVLNLSAECPYCVKSIPFYRQLKTISERSENRLIIATQFENSKSGKDFLDRHALVGVIALGPPPTELSTGLIPTLLLAGKDNKVVRTWVGYLNEHLQREVLSEIRELCPACDGGLVLAPLR